MRYQTTRHAEIRMQQRGIPAWMIELLMEHGKARRGGGGVRNISLPTKTMRRLNRRLTREEFVRLEKHRDVFLVIADDGAIVTIGHRTRRYRVH